jgi:hypothetical protein
MVGSRAMRRLLLAALVLVGGCRTFDPKHPLVGKPESLEVSPAIYLWIDDSEWHVRLVGGGHGLHRFQGSVAGVHGGVLALALTRPELKDAIAAQGDAVQFDVESDAVGGRDGFDVKVAGGCARFDLYVDGRHHADRIRMGPRLHRPSHIPFDRCP